MLSLNNTSDYQTNGLYRTPNTDPSLYWTPNPNPSLYRTPNPSLFVH